MNTTKTLVRFDQQNISSSIPHYKAIPGFKNKNRCDLSEYQAVYKKLPFQKPRQCIRPRTNKYQIAAPMRSDTTYKIDYAEPKVTTKDKTKLINKNKSVALAQYTYLKEEVTRSKLGDRKSTYAADFGPKEIQKRRPFTAAGEQSYRPRSGPFQGQSMYQTSYLEYSQDEIALCKANKTVPHSLLYSNVDRLKDEFLSESEIFKAEDLQLNNPKKSNSKSGNPCSKPPEDNCKNVKNKDESQKQKPTETPEKTNESVSVQVPEPSPNIESDVFMISTFMADFKPHWNVEMRHPRKPEETNYRQYYTKFDGTTTSNAEYKAWPVHKPEVPKWAEKPVYKVPVEHMALNSTYMMEFTDPKVIQTVAKMKKPIKDENIIKQGGKNIPFNQKTTYNLNFPEYKGAKPAESYLVQSVYNPPTEKMDCESTHRKYYKGEQTQKTQLIRHASEHRQLNKDGKFNFKTTYREMFKDFRPKSCPAAIRGSLIGVQVKKAWEEEKITKTQMNDSHDSGIDLID